jgi:hypothetical protein
LESFLYLVEDLEKRLENKGVEVIIDSLRVTGWRGPQIETTKMNEALKNYKVKKFFYYPHSEYW